MPKPPSSLSLPPAPIRRSLPPAVELVGRTAAGEPVVAGAAEDVAGGPAGSGEDIIAAAEEDRRP